MQSSQWVCISTLVWGGVFTLVSGRCFYSSVWEVFLLKWLCFYSIVGRYFYSSVCEVFLLWCIGGVSTLVSVRCFYSSVGRCPQSGLCGNTLTEDSQRGGGRHRAQVVTGNTAVCSRVLVLCALNLQPAGELKPLGSAPGLGRGQRERIHGLITWPKFYILNILSAFSKEILNSASHVRPPGRPCLFSLKIKERPDSETHFL